MVAAVLVVMFVTCHGPARAEHCRSVPYALPQAALAQGAAPRIPTPQALAATIKKVDPIVPPAAVSAKVWGTVIANVIVRADGTVESVDVIDGPALLRQAAIDALRQWTFKPFVVNGRPARIVSLLEVVFPDPALEEARRLDEEWKAASPRCRHAIERAVTTSPAICAEVLALSDRLPPGRVLDRRRATADLAEALLLNGRRDEARTQMEKALGMGGFTLGDAQAAGDYALLASIYVATEELRKADDSFALAVGLYDRAISAAPGVDDATGYRERLRTTLLAYSALKGKLGDTAASAALEGRAKALEIGGPAVSRP
jgi:tetratricopeptide (TPR) repeat protein